MKWFRLYDELLDDPKTQQLPASLFKVWINLLCVANRSNPRGTLPDVPSIAFHLRVPETRVVELLEELSSFGLLDCDARKRYSPHNWNGRQRVSDNVSTRVQKHRETVSSNGNVTLHETLQPQNGNVSRNGNETFPHARATETETDTETENTLASVPRAPAREAETAAPYGARNLPRTPIPDDWDPDELTLLTAHNAGLTVEETVATLEKFQRHHKTKGTLNADWQSAARSWLIDEPRFRPVAAAAGKPIPIRDDVIQHGDEIDLF